MRKSFTAVLERNQTFTADFETEPYEVGWAAEARWFVRVLELEGVRAGLRLNSQISPDGLEWCDHEEPERFCTEPELITMPVRDFGQWLRLRVELPAPDSRVKVQIYLACKS